MDLSNGYRLDQPDILVPWDITWRGLRELLADWSPVTFSESDKPGFSRSATLRCASLGNLWHDMVVSFAGDSLYSFELRFPDSAMEHGVLNFDKSFPLFQQHLQSTFGSPIILRQASPGAASPYERFPDCEWRVGGIQVRHAIGEYWGPVERLTIQPLASARSAWAPSV